VSDTWQALGRVDPETLVDARLQLHHAAQVVSALGTTFLEPRPDDSHPNLGWEDAAFVGRALPGEAGLRGALGAADLSLRLVDASSTVREQLELGGRSVEEAYAWLAAALGRQGMEPPASGLARPSYTIPEHPVASGAAFSLEPRESFSELASWYTDAAMAISEVGATAEEATELRVWPHHFDLGLLVVLESDAQGSATKTIGVGLSPGDESHAQPYLYVSPWPYPSPERLPGLPPPVQWHTDGHTSAILRGSDLAALDPAQQRQRLGGYLADAIAASRCALA